MLKLIYNKCISCHRRAMEMREKADPTKDLPLCEALADVRQYHISSFFLGLAIHLDDQVVVASVVA